MTKTKPKQGKKHFEANILDGDPVNDCGGAMLSAKSVWEYISEHYDLKQGNKESKVLFKGWVNSEVLGSSTIEVSEFKKYPADIPVHVIEAKPLKTSKK